MTDIESIFSPSTGLPVLSATPSLITLIVEVSPSGVRWDSDHVVILSDELEAIAQEIGRGEYLSRVPIGLDYFDASINMDRYSEPPRVVLLQNHGVISLSRSIAQVENITAMMVKTARVLLGTFAAGGPRFMPQVEVERIHGRPDEHYRRRQLGTEDSSC